MKLLGVRTRGRARMPRAYPEPAWGRNALSSKSVAALILALLLGLPLSSGDEAGGVLYCPDGVYLLSEKPLSLKAFRKGTLLRLALPYRRPEWRMNVRFAFRKGRMVWETLETPRPFPRTRIALVKVCLGDRCREGPKAGWKTHWDERTRTLWIHLTHRGPIKRVSVRLVFGEGECGGYLYYEKDGLPW